ncbi:MAG: hypothetical protein NVSMB12_21640 [Acidimicrobiales bacterium]
MRNRSPGTTGARAGPWGMRRWPAIVLVVALAAGVGELAIYRNEQAPAAHAAPPAPPTTVATTTSTTPVAAALAPGAPAEPAPGAPVVPPQGAPSASTAPPCGPDQVAFVVSTPSPAFPPGATVDATARQTNIGDQPCRWPGDIRFTWRDANGGQFELARADVQPVSVQWQPGQVLEQHATWDQRFANGSPAALGFAAVIVSWGPAGGPANTASAPFVIGTPLPAPTTAAP